MGRGLVVALLALLLAAPAQAGTVRLQDNSFWDAEIYFEAAPGEANDVDISYGRDVTQEVLQALPFPFETFPGATTIVDHAHPITDTGECSRLDAHAVSCPPGPVHVALGDGDDRLDLGSLAREEPTPPFNGYEGVALGGPGDDELAADAGKAFLAGEDGHDRLVGEAGTQGFAGGAGDDEIRSFDTVGEQVFCGPGDDLAFADPLDTRARTCEHWLVR